MEERDREGELRDSECERERQTDRQKERKKEREREKENGDKRSILHCGLQRVD